MQRINVPIDSDVYLSLTRLKLRQRDKGRRGFGRQGIGMDRVILELLRWVTSLPDDDQDRIFDSLAETAAQETETVVSA